jgi:hypothetical protein
MWRDAPMTDKQQRFMAFLGHKVTPDMTRGQVSDLIAIAPTTLFSYGQHRFHAILCFRMAHHP